MSVGNLGAARKTSLRVGMVALALLIGMGVLGRAEDRAVKSRVAPVYPEIAKRMRITGVVKMEVTVDAEGKVTDVKTVSGNHMLAVTAEETVRKWKFSPGAGQSTVPIDMNFDLGQ